MTREHIGTPTEYGGVLMRSQVESWFARAMDSLEIAWEYEPHSFVGEDGHYRWLPDFRLDLGHPVYVEVKYRLGGNCEAGPSVKEVQAETRTKVSCAWLTDPSLELFLVEYSDALRERPGDIPPMGFVGRDGRWYRGTIVRCTCGRCYLWRLLERAPCPHCGLFDDRSSVLWPFRRARA